MAQPCLQTPERAKRPPGTSTREAPFRLVRDTADDGPPDDGMTLDGWGALFNTSTVIDSWEGRFREQIAPGSMKRSFRESPPKIQFDHGRHPLIGSIPIATLRSVTEDTHPELAPNGGAHIVGRLLENERGDGAMWLVEPVRAALASGAVDGMSFRFDVLQESWVRADGSPIRTEPDLVRELDRVYLEDLSDDDLPLRTLRQLKVSEMGPVTWPAYAETSVGVRGKVIDLGKLDDPKQRKLLARAVWTADRLEASAETQRAQDTPMGGEDQDDDPAALAGSLDAILDEASGLLSGVDLSTLPPEVAQACALVVGAETVADELLEAMGIYDPDDYESDEDEGRSGQPPTHTAERHPNREQRTTIAAGEHSDGQRATDQAGEHQPIQRGSRRIDLWVGKSRDVLLSIEAKKGLMR